MTTAREGGMLERGWIALVAGLGLAWGATCAGAETPAQATPTTCFVEAEGASTGTPWVVKEAPDASGGKVLFCPRRSGLAESPGIAINVPRAGRYQVWVRFVKRPATPSNLPALVRDEAGQVLSFARLDWQTRFSTETPYLPPDVALSTRTGFVWQALGLAIDRPLEARVCFSGTPGEQSIDCVLLTSDTGLDPDRISVERLPALGTTAAAAPLPRPSAPAGFVRSDGLPARPESFAGIDDPDRRFWAGLINVGALYIDGAYMARMGFNRDHNLASAPWGLRSGVPMEQFSDATFTRANPAPTGRFVNAKGQVGQAFSLHYPPFVAAASNALVTRLTETLKGDTSAVGHWRISAEEGGWMDYSSYAQEAFRAWLAAKHGTITALNQRWGTQYTTFADIVPAASYDEGRASWLEFREFSGHAYAESVGRRVATVQSLDRKRRPCLGANSNLDIGAPYFMAIRPNDWEELIRVGLKDEHYVAFDIYCADDDMGSAIEFLTSLAQGRKLINQEFSNHATDARIAARSYWVQVAKGVHGIHLFNFQQGDHASYPKWALLSYNGTPKHKLAAYADAVQEVHRLEPLLMAATYTRAVKPVALYWSRIDLGLEVPHDSWYGHGLDSPIHIYETLRSQGYPVRWITPRQIAEGELADVGALVLADCNHIPQAAAARIEAWVKAGGAAIADGWPGAFDEYGQPQATLAPVFGVRPAPKKGAPTGSLLALQESRQGYGEVTDAAGLREKVYEKVEEVAQQPGGTHPVSRAMGDFMLTGIALERVECATGKVVAMTHRSPGWPGFVANDYGQGKSLYSALLLGTIYESAPVRYEWDSAHSGLSYGRLLNAFLRYAGVQPDCRVTGLAPHVRAKVRVESPLITPDGNALVGLTSMNDDAVKPFDLEIVWPPSARPPTFTKVLVATGGSRRLESVDYTTTATNLKLRMPSFDTHAMILALRTAAPLVHLDLQNVARGPAGLGVIQPGTTFTVEAVIHNPAPRSLAAGTLAFTTPAGWFQSSATAAVSTIPAGGEARCAFRVRAPETAGLCRLEPFVARFANDRERSTPATEMVWWGLPAPAAE